MTTINQKLAALRSELILCGCTSASGNPSALGRSLGGRLDRAIRDVRLGRLAPRDLRERLGLNRGD